MRGKPIPQNIREKIIFFRENKMPLKNIAEKTNLFVSTINSILRNYSKNGKITNKPKPGIKRCTSERQDRVIVRKILNDRRLSIGKLKEELSTELKINICSKTLRRRLKEAGLTSRIAKRKPLISSVNQKKRYQWAKKYSSWTLNQWKAVLWSDETRINQFGSDGIIRTWQKKGDKLIPQCTRSTVKHGGSCISVWGSISGNGMGNFQFIDGIMTKEVYNNILVMNLPHSASTAGINGRFVFQQDNDPKHTAAINKKWLVDNNIKTLEWPSQSPDLNIIEHLWANIKVRVGKRKPRNVQEMKLFFKEEWDNTPKEFLKKLLESIPKRIAAVIRSRGAHTKY